MVSIATKFLISVSIFTVHGLMPASAEYWSSLNISPRYELTGGDCASVAFAQYNNFYGQANRYSFEMSSTNTCSVAGFGPGIINGEYRFEGSGSASLVCDEGSFYMWSGACMSEDDLTAANTAIDPPCGNPVLPLSGSKIETVVDYSTAGPNALSFLRYYGRRGRGFIGDFKLSNRLGVNWRSSFDATLLSLNEEGSHIFVLLPDGKEFLFLLRNGAYSPGYYVVVRNSVGTLLGATEYANRKGATEKLTVSNQNYILDYEDKKWHFSKAGKFLQIDYIGGYQQFLQYDASGRNSSVSDSFGRTLTFTYDSGGRMSTLTTMDGKVITYSYLLKTDPVIAQQIAGFSNLAVMSVLEQVNNTLGQTPTVRKYHYETTGISRRVNYQLTGITDERGVRYATFAYDSKGRAITSEHVGGLDKYSFNYPAAGGTAVGVTNPAGKVTNFNFSVDAYNVKKLSSVEGQPSANCPLSNAILSYDANNFFSTMVDEEGRKTTYVRDAQGRPTSITRGAP